MKKKYKRSELIKKLKKFNVNDVELSYKKGEGWWLTCDVFDNWISMDSYGAMIAIEKIFNKS